MDMSRSLLRSVLCAQILVTACSAPPVPMDGAMMAAMSGVGETLEREEVETFAGLWIEYDPYRYVVAFTRDGDAAIRRHVTDTKLLAMIEVRSFEYSLAGLMRTQTEVDAQVRALGIRADSMIDVKRNRVVVTVADDAALSAGLRAANVVLPASVVVEEGPLF